jgi:hypothetical protein
MPVILKYILTKNRVEKTMNCKNDNQNAWWDYTKGK